MTTYAAAAPGRLVAHSGYLTVRSVRALIRQPWFVGATLVQPIVWLLLFGRTWSEARRSRDASLRLALAFLGALGGHAPGTGFKYHPALYLNTEVALALAAGVVCSLPLVELLSGHRPAFQPRGR